MKNYTFWDQLCDEIINTDMLSSLGFWLFATLFYGLIGFGLYKWIF